MKNPQKGRRHRCRSEKSKAPLGEGLSRAAMRPRKIKVIGDSATGSRPVGEGLQLEVEDYHTYFVSATEDGPSIWAHNTVCALEGTDESASAEGQALATRAKDLL